MQNKTIRTPFRYDIVGSFLRPAALKKQRAAAARCEISAAALRAAEDAAIRDLVAKEKAAGLRAVTDGELRAFRVRGAWRTSTEACAEFIERGFADQRRRAR